MGSPVDIRLAALAAASSTLASPATEAVLLSRAAMIEEWVLSGKLPPLPEDAAVA